METVLTMMNVEFVEEVTPLVEVVQMLHLVTTILQMQLLTMVHVHRMICVESVEEIILLAVDVRMKMAQNYDSAAMYDDGSCSWGDGLSTGLSYEVVSSDPLGTGATTYRLYANFTAAAAEVTAVYGTGSNPWEMTSSAVRWLL